MLGRALRKRVWHFTVVEVIFFHGFVATKFLGRLDWRKGDRATPIASN
jgi:hypothetical protein